MKGTLGTAVLYGKITFEVSFVDSMIVLSES